MSENEEFTADIPADDEPKIWSQSQLNTAFKSHRKGLQERLAIAEQKLAELQSQPIDWQQKLDTEIGAHKAEIGELADVHSKVVADLASKHHATIAEMQAKYNSLESKFQAEAISRELTTAATTGDAVHPEQVVGLLKPYASVNGDAIVINIDGFSLSPTEAIKWMSDQPEKYGNLFRANVVGGLGSNSMIGGATGKRTTDVRSMSHADYRKLKQTNPRALGLEPQS